MLMSSLADRYAYQLLEARAQSRNIVPISSTSPLNVTDAYDIAKSLDTIRVAEGEHPVGRKLGLLKRRFHHHQDDQQDLIFTTLFSSTVRFLNEAIAVQSLTGALQPKLEPLVVFKFARTPNAHCTLNELADSLEWMAHGVEIVVNPYSDNPYTGADVIAGFGMHGTLLIAEPHILSNATRLHLGYTLAEASVSVSCDERIIGAGYGNNIMLNPLNALWYLHKLINSQLQFPKLQAGEIITSGTWTNSYSIKPGQTWTTAFSGIGLAGLTLSFV